jgi:ABC-type branched-subunit amino acid transport system substrate-binding protein
MKQLFVIFAFITSLMLLTVQPAHAQFWKKIFKKEKSAKTDKSKQDSTDKDSQNKNPKKRPRQSPEYPASELKASYRVDVLLPLGLDALTSKQSAKQSNEGSQIGINFYEGLRIACDSLATQNVRLQVYVHDIYDEKGKVSYLIDQKIMDATDLIIGAVQSNEIPPLAQFAKDKKVNFVSALSPADVGQENNPYFIIVQPTLRTHIEAMIQYGKMKFGTAPTYLIYRDNEVEKESYKHLKNGLEAENLTEIKCSSTVSTDFFIEKFDSSRVNVVYVNALEIDFAGRILNALAALPASYRLEVLGMPSWKAIHSITVAGQYPNMNIYFTTPFYFDPTTRNGQYVQQEYKKYSAAKPSEMVYRGYETVYWLGNLLHRHGRYFNNQIQSKQSAPFSNYQVSPQYNDDNNFLYLENKELKMFKYSNGSYMVE